MQRVLDDETIPNLAVVIAKAGENKTKASLRGEWDPIEAAVRVSEIDQTIPAITPQSANAATATEAVTARVIFQLSTQVKESGQGHLL